MFYRYSFFKYFENLISKLNIIYFILYKNGIYDNIINEGKIKWRKQLTIIRQDMF